MKSLRQLFIGFAVALSVLVAIPALSAATRQKPNIVFILADDLGYGDIGPFGQQKIRTPNLDRMAAEGMRSTQHYSGSPVCAPSRCVFMTGKHPGHAWIRDNREIKPEGQQPLPADTVTLPKLLKQHGYATAAIGKWGLGFPGSEGEPMKQGFDRFFGYNCQRQAHNYYPSHLWDNQKRITLDNIPFSPHQKLPAAADLNSPESYRGYQGKVYAPDLFCEQALKFIQDNKDNPFFLYFATTVPHLALQVPNDSLAEYKGNWPETPYLGTNNYLPHIAPRSAYAAMVTRLDRDIGRIFSLLRELNLQEKTICIFTSDNGPLYDQLGGTDTDFFQSADSLRGRKGSVYEGGMRVPMIVRWAGHVAARKTSARVTGFEDWMPTLLDLIGVSSRPANIDGISFAPTLLGKQQPPRPFLYREFPNYDGQQMARIGDWKGVRQNLMPRKKSSKRVADPLQLELYDLKNDPGETNDISSAHPDIVGKMEKIMQEQHQKSQLFPIPVLDANVQPEFK